MMPAAGTTAAALMMVATGPDLVPVSVPVFCLRPVSGHDSMKGDVAGTLLAADFSHETGLTLTAACLSYL